MQLTIFTPTYNRKKYLTRLYRSLIQQQQQYFEWLIIDDGSTDGTKQFINELIEAHRKKPGSFKIRYYHQENSGKMIAYNAGLDLARGKFFYCVDSDDFLPDNTIHAILDSTKKLERKTPGIIGVKMDIRVPKPQGQFPDNTSSSRINEIYTKHHFRGELALIFNLELTRHIKFPIIGGEKFIPEAYLYDIIDSQGECMVMNQTIYLYDNYQEDGYTKNFLRTLSQNPQGFMLYYWKHYYCTRNFKERLKSLIMVSVCRNIFKAPFPNQGHPLFEVVVKLMLPLSMLYIRRKERLQ